MTDRATAIDAFITTTGWAHAQRTPITPDASKRRYTRLTQGEKSAIFMDCPPDASESTHSFVKIAHHLRQLGLGAPEIYAHDPLNGFVLTQDLGELRFADEFRMSPDIAAPRYNAAIDALAYLAKHPAPTWLPEMRAPQYVGFLDRLFDFYLLEPVSDDIRQEITEKLIETTAPVFDTNLCLTLRDCHAENLIWDKNAQGKAKVGLIDFQDATQSHPNYDVTSLIYDVRRTIAPDLRQHLMQRFAQATDSHKDDFLYSSSALILLRNLRILGGFARLARQDGKLNYLKWAPRAWEFVMFALENPNLAHIGPLIHRHIPAPTPTYFQGFSQC